MSATGPESVRSPQTNVDLVRRRDSLRTRLVLWSSLTTAALLAVLVLVFYLGVRAEMIATTKAKADGLALQTVSSLESNLDSVQAIGRSLAASGSGVGNDPANLRALLHATLVGDPDIAGAMMIVEPGKLGAHDAGFTWYVRRDGKRLVEQSVEDLGYDYRSKTWYVRTMAARAPWWSEPYANAATAGEHFTTYNLPLRAPDAGADAPAIGMVSVDVPVARLRDIIEQLPDDPGLQPQLYTPDGVPVAGDDAATASRMSLTQLTTHAEHGDLSPLLWAHAQRQPTRFDYDDGRRMMIGLPVAGSGWYLSVSITRSYILQRLNRVALWVALGALPGLLLSLWGVRRYTGRITRPLEDLSDSARELSRGHFDYPLRHTGRSDEVGVLARTLDRARRSIKQQMLDLQEMGAARQKHESELSIARDIQLSMLSPGRMIERDGTRLEAHAQLEAAKAVGGDFYCFLERGDGELWFAIGDVSDKGVPAALFMARAITVLEVAAHAWAAPDQVLAEASRRLVEGNDTCMFATVLCGHLDARSGRCTLANAAHEPPLLLHADGRVETIDMESGPPLGFEVSANFPLWHGQLPAGASLLAYTDGVTEAFNPANEAFGIARLQAALRSGDSAREHCERVIAEVHAFAGSAPQSDDITMLAIRRQTSAPLPPTPEENDDVDTTDRPG